VPDPACDVHVRRQRPELARIAVAADRHEHAHWEEGQRVERVAVHAREEVHRRGHRAERQVDQRPRGVLPPIRQRPRLVVALAEAQCVGGTGRRGVLELLRHQREVRERGEERAVGIGGEAEVAPDAVERLRDDGAELDHVHGLRDPDADRRHSGRLGCEAGGEVGGVEQHDIRSPALDRTEHVRVVRGRVHPDEQVADDHLVGVVVAHPARLGEPLRAALRRGIWDRVVVEAGGGDHRRRLDGRGDDDRVVVSQKGFRKRNKRPEMAGSGSSADHDAHRGQRRPRAHTYSRASDRRRGQHATHGQGPVTQPPTGARTRPAWISLRPIVSHTPSPEFRCDWAEKHEDNHDQGDRGPKQERSASAGDAGRMRGDAVDHDQVPLCGAGPG
jgi:hypothetical protein